MIKEICMRPFGTSFFFQIEASKWWKSLDEGIRQNTTWEVFGELFLDKWINDTTTKVIYKIQYELKEEK
jgi:hypothetical protein